MNFWLASTNFAGMETTTVFLSLGSNLGDREQMLHRAVEAIELHIGPVTIASKTYETLAWGMTDTPDFLNQVIAVSTDLLPSKLLQTIHRIEQSLGRIRNPEIKEYVSRTIDIDILYVGNKVITSKKLIIPHPFLHKRSFVLVPLNEIAAGFIHPGLNLSNHDLMLKLGEESLNEVKLYSR